LTDLENLSQKRAARHEARRPLSRLERADLHSSPETERRSSPYVRAGLGRGSLMTQQDRRWLAISIVWLFLTLGMLLYVGFA
jgi:hypothetical protein